MTLTQVLDRYGIGLVITNYDDVPIDFCSGPCGAGLSWKLNRVIDPIRGADRVAERFHEAMHLVCAQRESDIADECEGEGLLQLERIVAQHMCTADFDAVLKYQTVTVVIPTRKDAEQMAGATSPKVEALLREGIGIAGDDSDFDMGWWKRGFRRAIRLGLLTPRGEPTWMRRRKMKWAKSST